jgi:hypothetical protein
MVMPKSTTVFDAHDSRFGAPLKRINERMLALQERVAKFAETWLAFEGVSQLSTPNFPPACLVRFRTLISAA